MARKRRETWYTIDQVILRLGMREERFRAYIRHGIFPRGIKDYGSRVPVWSYDDIRWMQRRKAMTSRFPRKLRELFARERKKKPPGNSQKSGAQGGASG